jgi:predicted DNA-binding transcriptional regulator AlpA
MGPQPSAPTSAAAPASTVSPGSRRRQPEPPPASGLVPALQERLWSLEETADYLGVPSGTLHQWNSRGVGPRSFRVGRYRRYHPSDVARWLDEHASSPAPAGDAA